MAGTGLDTRNYQKVDSPDAEKDPLAVNRAQEGKGIAEIINPKNDPKYVEEQLKIQKDAMEWGGEMAIKYGVGEMEYNTPTPPGQKVEMPKLNFPTGSTGGNFADLRQKTQELIHATGSAVVTEYSGRKPGDTPPGETYVSQKLKETAKEVFDPETLEMPETSFFTSTRFVLSKLLTGMGNAVESGKGVGQLFMALWETPVNQWTQVFADQTTSSTTPRFVPKGDVPAVLESLKLVPKMSDPNILGGNEKTSQEITEEIMRENWTRQEAELLEEKK